MSETSPSPGETARQNSLEGFKNSLGAALDRLIVLIDANSPETAVAQAEKAIADAAKRVEAYAINWLAAVLPEAAANSVSSSDHLHEIARERANAKSILANLAAPNTAELVLAIFYAVAAVMAFFTELKLTDALVDLLGYPKDDPTGRAIGAAFASSMLVFELICAKLCLTEDPWPFFHRALSERPLETNSPGAKLGRYFHVAPGVALILIFLFVAGFTTYTVVKMAPTREIDARFARDKQQLSQTDQQKVEDSTLAFSVCILISGGFMAAAAGKEFSKFSRYKKLEKKAKELDEQWKDTITHLDKEEKPALAGALAAAGLHFLWLPVAPVDGFAAELKQALTAGLNGGNPIPEAIRAAAAAEAGIFAAEKQIALSNARAIVPPTEPPPPTRVRKSWREMVDDVLQGDVVS